VDGMLPVNDRILRPEDDLVIFRIEPRLTH
jgi:hypothetical protein